jgi:hypothetical protein
MQVVFRYRGFKFFFYSNEGTPLEPTHIHVERDDLEAKFWMFLLCGSPTMMGTIHEHFVSSTKSWKQTKT